MKEVFRHADSALVGLYPSMLEDAGIRTIVHNETQQLPVAGLLTAICPLPQFFPTLSVLNDEDYPEAMRILLDLKDAPIGTAGEWTCSGCGELVPDNFSACWKCENLRDLPSGV